MKDYTLAKEETAELERFHRSLRDKRQADRVKAVIALSKGWSAARGLKPGVFGTEKGLKIPEKLFKILLRCRQHSDIM